MVTTHLVVFFFGGASRGDAPPPVVVEESRGRSGRRYRIIEDPDRIEEELKQEQVAVKKDKKQLKILVKKLDADPPVGIYNQLIEKVAVVENRIDERLQRIEALHAMIAQAFEEQNEDDEEVLLLS